MSMLYLYTSIRKYIKTLNTILAIYLATSNKKKISSVQLGKYIDISQQSTWFMLHRIREAKGIKLKKAEFFQVQPKLMNVILVAQIQINIKINTIQRAMGVDLFKIDMSFNEAIK